MHTLFIYEGDRVKERMDERENIATIYLYIPTHMYYVCIILKAIKLIKNATACRCFESTSKKSDAIIFRKKNHKEIKIRHN